MKGKMFSFITEKPYHKLPSLETLERLYYADCLSAGQIAEQYGSSFNAVTLRLNRAGLPLRSLSEAQELVANHVELTTDLQSLFDGLLLGDGCIVPSNMNQPEYSHSAWYSHADKHKEYIKWLASELAKHNISVRTTVRNGYPLLQSLCYRELFSLRQMWYPQGFKKVPLDLELTPSILRNWYIGDGNFRKGKNHTKKSERVMIAIFFDDRGKSLLSARLHELGISNTIIPEGIYIRAKTRRTFFQYILSDNPYIPSCYLYKFPEEYCYD